MISQKRLAIIGTTDIAIAHINAARAVGFEVLHVAGSFESSSAVQFGATHSVANVWKDPLELAADKNSWDAIILAATTSAMIELVLAAHSTGKPTLAEKPVGLSAASLKPVLSADRNVFVGFNRRFYGAVQEALSFMQEGGPCLLHLELPESVLTDAKTGFRDLTRVTTNSTHGLDLVNYLTGGLSIVTAHSIGSTSERLGKVIVAKSQRGDICSISANWNAPANFSLTIDRGDHRFELRPLEVGRLFHGMEIVPPTSEIPLRRFVPQQIAEFMPDRESVAFKPGFVPQCQALFDLVDGKQSAVAARLHDAQLALELAEALIAS